MTQQLLQLSLRSINTHKFQEVTLTMATQASVADEEWIPDRA